MKQVLIIGAGGHARPVVEIATLNQISIAGIIDINYNGQDESILDVPVIGGIDRIKDYSIKETSFFVAIGDNTERRNWMNKIKAFGGIMISLIHPSAIISNSVWIGAGSLICAGVILNPLVKIGEGCIINTGTIIDHESSIGDFSHLAPGVKLAGRVTLNKNCFVGIGTVIIDQIRIEDNVTIGAGSTIIKDIAAHSKVVGVSKTIT